MTVNQINEDEFYFRFGDKIKSYRQKKNLTQEQLAQLIHLKRTSITNIEKGKQKTPFHVVVAMCYALEIELNDLIPSVRKVLGSKITEVEYLQVGDISKPVSKSTFDVISEISKSL